LLPAVGGIKICNKIAGACLVILASQIYRLISSQCKNSTTG
jgi:hypothetical protein